VDESDHCLGVADKILFLCVELAKKRGYMPTKKEKKNPLSEVGDQVCYEVWV
jgi:hypothetical protein